MTKEILLNQYHRKDELYKDVLEQFGFEASRPELHRAIEAFVRIWLNHEIALGKILSYRGIEVIPMDNNHSVNINGHVTIEIW